MSNQLIDKEYMQSATALNECFLLVKNNRKVPTTIFHYTNGTAFLEIIKSRKLWLTHNRGMNDESELIYGRTLWRMEVERRLKREKNKEWRGIYEALLTSRASIPHIYLACFSKLDDDLSQWRGYGDSVGYTLGFDTATMESQALARQFLFAPVVYGEKKSRTIIKTALDAMEKIISQNTN